MRKKHKKSARHNTIKRNKRRLIKKRQFQKYSETATRISFKIGKQHLAKTLNQVVSVSIKAIISEKIAATYDTHILKILTKHKN